MSDRNASEPLIGYKRPPLETRFEKGRSGNPNGRPRGSKNYDSILKLLLRKKVPKAPDSERRAHPKSLRDFIIGNIVDSAIDGDLRSMKQVWKYMQKYDNRPETVRTKVLPVNLKVRAAFMKARLAQEARETHPKAPSFP